MSESDSVSLFTWWCKKSLLFTFNYLLSNVKHAHSTQSSDHLEVRLRWINKITIVFNIANAERSCPPAVCSMSSTWGLSLSGQQLQPGRMTCTLSPLPLWPERSRGVIGLLWQWDGLGDRTCIVDEVVEKIMHLQQHVNQCLQSPNHKLSEALVP